MKIEEAPTTTWTRCELTDSFGQLISDWMKRFFHTWEIRFAIVIGWADWMKKLSYEFFMESILSEDFSGYEIKMYFNFAYRSTVAHKCHAKIVIFLIILAIFVATFLATFSAGSSPALCDNA